MTTWSSITWETARAGGFASYILLTTAVSLGLVLRNRWQSTRWPRLITNELHGYVSLLALVFIAIHVVAVAVDPFTRFGLADVLIPFVSRYRTIWMGLGLVALYLLLAVWASSRLRHRIGHRLWRRIHVLAYGVYAAATVHGLGTGSDTRAAWAAALYATSVGIVGALLTIRLLAPAGKESRRRPLVAATAGIAVLAASAWAFAGPFAPGWAARAGSATKQASPAAVRVVGHTTTVSAVVHPPFRARFSGKLTVQPTDQSGRLTVRIDGALSGATKDHLEILIHGIPLSDGGVSMEQSRVRMGTTTALYTGTIIALSGTRIVMAMHSAHQRVLLGLTLRIAQNGQVSGVVAGAGTTSQNSE